MAIVRTTDAQWFSLLASMRVHFGCDEDDLLFGWWISLLTVSYVIIWSEASGVSRLFHRLAENCDVNKGHSCLSSFHQMKSSAIACLRSIIYSRRKLESTHVSHCSSFQVASMSKNAFDAQQRSLQQTIEWFDEMKTCLLSMECTWERTGWGMSSVTPVSSQAICKHPIESDAIDKSAQRTSKHQGIEQNSAIAFDRTC